MPGTTLGTARGTATLLHATMPGGATTDEDTGIAHNTDLWRAHRTEIAAAFAVLFSVVTAIGAVFFASPKNLRFAEKWADQNWVKSSCTVEEAGVAYRGICQIDVSIIMTRYQRFAECQGPSESAFDAEVAFRNWEHNSEAGRCATQGNDDYRSATGQAATVDETDLTLNARRLIPIQVVQPNMPNHLDCYNSYLPWAVVRLSNDSTGGSEIRCAYEFGASAPSVTGDWSKANTLYAQLKQNRDVQQPTPCWVLRDDDCVVAFHDQAMLTRQEHGNMQLVQVSGMVSMVFAVLCALAACRFHLQDRKLGTSGGYHQKLATEDPYEIAKVPLTDRVARAVQAAASRLGQDSPTSGTTTPRSGTSPRTIEVIDQDGKRRKVPRNVASDFFETKLPSP